MKDKKLQWHPAFVAAMQLELRKDREFLEFYPEHNLSTKPLSIDLLVKESAEIETENEIGKIFRKYNVLEYKSPDDKLDDDTLHKAFAYGHLLVFCGDSTLGQSIGEDEVTISLVRYRKPFKLLKYLKDRGCRVDDSCPGIYRVAEGFYFPVQIVVTKELDLEQHSWLRALTLDLDSRVLRSVADSANSLQTEFERGCADSVIDFSLRANQSLVKELGGDDGMSEFLRELFKPELQAAVAKERSAWEERQAAWEERQAAWENEKAVLERNQAAWESEKAIMEKTQAELLKQIEELKKNQK